MKKQDETEIGFKKPPRAHQFSPGHSGNPAGRPKGVRNFKTDLREELSELFTIRDNGQEVTVTKQRALIKGLVAAAIAGNARAVHTVMTFYARAIDDDIEDEVPPEDREIMKAFPRPAKQSKSHNVLKIKES